MKFVLLVEGQTESKVIPQLLKRWIEPKLAGVKKVGIDPIIFHGSGDLRREVAKYTRTTLNDPHHERDIIAVVSLLDFYRSTIQYPKGIDSVDERCQWAKRDIEGKVGEKRFRQFFAVHELEAWLLSQPGIFPAEIKPHLPKRAPETVNSTEPPKALLNRLYIKHTRKKYKVTDDGLKLFKQLNPEEAYRKCPHLQEMLDEMLKLALKAEL
ncbi:MAG: DUF4276 family protein [bacterium]